MEALISGWIARLVCQVTLLRTGESSSLQASARSWASLITPPAVEGCPEGTPAGAGLGLPAALGPAGLKEKANISSAEMVYGTALGTPEAEVERWVEKLRSKANSFSLPPMAAGTSMKTTAVPTQPHGFDIIQAYHQAYSYDL